MTRAVPPHPATEILAGTLAPAAPNIVQLLLARPFRADRDVLLRALREAIGEVDALPSHDEDAAMFGYPRSGASKPQAHLVSKVDLAAILPDLEPALQQTWHWGAARDAVSKARAAIAFNDMPTGGLKERLALFQRALRVLIVQFPVVAIHWLSSQRMVDPVAYLEPDSKDPLFQGPLNVRMFRVENSDQGGTLMDTMGLAPLGLPDLEHRFTALDPSLVSARLFQYAHYLYERGDIIEDGHTVDGIHGRWTCRVRDSSAGPARRVLAFVDAGLPLAPGQLGVACPECGWVPDSLARWECECGFTWNTFDTRGLCPACAKEWLETRCLKCRAMTAHRRWYPSAAR